MQQRKQIYLFIRKQEEQDGEEMKMSFVV